MPQGWNRRQILRAATALPFAAAAWPAELELPGAVRIGLIGLHGHFGEALTIARADPRIRIVAYETTSERETQRGGGNPLLAEARRYDDYRRLLDAEELDLAVICDENWRRAETTAACLERKIPTAAEKPLALSIADLDALRSAYERARTPLTMLLPMRHDADFVAMRDIVRRGDIGEPVNLSGQKSYQLGERPDWMTRRESFGGSIPYIACHVVDLLRFVSGRDMVETAAFHGNVGFPEMGEMENTAAISYRLDNGGTGDVRLDYLRPVAAPSHGDDRIRIAGTDGVIERQADKVTLVTDREPPHEILERPETRPLLADFLDFVYNRKEPSLTADEAFRVSRIVLRSREAADAGRVLKI